MNKHKVILNIFKNKILFIFERYKYNNNKISTSKDFSFLSIISFVIITRFFKFIVKNESNEDSFNMSYLKDISNKKKLISTFKIFKKKMIKEFNLINIIEIDVLIYYYLTRNKNNKLFSLIMNKIYNILYKSFSIRII